MNFSPPFFHAPGSGSLQPRVLQPVHIGHLRLRPVLGGFQSAPADPFEPGLLLDLFSPNAIQRLLQQHGLSRMTGSSSISEEWRSFLAECAGSIWYGDVMHGSKVLVRGEWRKTYLAAQAG